MSFPIEFFSSSMLVFSMIFLAEIGDKSQLVCMTLASKHKAKPVAIGAILAFALLNLLAVVFGASLTHFIPQTWLTLAASALFLLFGFHSFFMAEDGEDEGGCKPKKPLKSVLLTTFMMIFIAELGDKTQLAVVTMSATHQSFAVWLGATLALGATSLIGVYAGRKLLAKININLLHKISGLFFIALGIMLLVNSY